MAAIIDEHTQYVDTGGRPLVGGKLYIGDVGSDPVANPVSVFSDRGLQTPAANPQTLDSNGRSTVKLFLATEYSIEVHDVNDVQQYSNLQAGETGGAINTLGLTNVLGANTITANGSTAIVAYVDKKTYTFTVVQTNTGASTLNIDGVGAKSVLSENDTELEGGELVEDKVIEVIFNEITDSFQITNKSEKQVFISHVGGLIYATGNTAPAGTILIGATRQILSRSTYPDLWTYVEGSGNIVSEGTASSSPDFVYGDGDGSTTFSIPKSGGQFIRSTGGNADSIGEEQSSENLAHSHDLLGASGNGILNVRGFGNTALTQLAASQNIAGDSPLYSATNNGGLEWVEESGEIESRPINWSLPVCIIAFNEINGQSQLEAQGVLDTIADLEAAVAAFEGLQNPFVSAEQTLTSGRITVSHGLGVTPREFWAHLVCKTANAGYSVGDNVIPEPYSGSGDAVGVSANTTDLMFTSGTGISLANTNGDDVSITEANWRVVLSARL